MQPVMTSWHVMALVTFHDMLWHLHEPPRHDMRTMSRRLMPSQGSEPETRWCPETDFGSSLMHLSDPVWYIYILDPIWCIRFWIRSNILHTLHFLIQLSQHTRTHSREGGFEWSSDVKELQLHFFAWIHFGGIHFGGIHFGGIHPTVLLWLLREAVRRIFHRVFIGKYSSQLSCQCFLCFAEEADARSSCTMMIASGSDCHRTARRGDHPPYILGSNVHWLDHHCCCSCCKAPRLKRTVLICNCRSFFGLNLV